MPHAADQLFVKVDGRQVDLAAAQLINAAIEQSLILPDAFSITLAEGLDWLKDDVFAIGKEVKIEAAGEGGSRRLLMLGEITGLMPSLTPQNDVELCIRGYDKSHRLLRGRHTRAFIQVTDSDIAKTIAREMGLGTKVEATDEVHEYVLQHEETNLQFIQQRAARIGFKVGVSEGNLYFLPLADPIEFGGLPVKLRWGETLDSFDVSRTTPGQATEVIVRGWDPKTKKAIVGEAKGSQAGPTTRRAEAGDKLVKSAFGMEAPMTVVRGDLDTQAEAESLAQVIADEMHGIFTTAEGMAGGTPELRAGSTVEVSGAGAFDGKYLVSAARHVFDRTGYSTTFKVEGARTALSVLGTPLAKPRPSMTFASGIVTNNQDPMKMGRVKVKLPAIRDDLESGWCRLVAPMAGHGRGFFALPELQDEVLVAFENGDMDRPFVIGALWNGQDTPPQGVLDPGKESQPDSARPAVDDTGNVNRRVWRSRSGHILEFDDTDRSEKLVIQDKNGNQIVIESASNTLKIVMKQRGNVEVEAPGNVSIKAQGNINIEAAGQLTLKGATVGIN